MTIAEDMMAMADDMMNSLGVPAVYRPQGGGQETAVTVRCKPRRKLTSESRTMWVMEISVRSTEVENPQFGDVFVLDGNEWRLTALPVEAEEIVSHALGALWLIVLTRDARPGRK